MDFKDRTLLITGGTGSFGNAVLMRFLTTEVKEIRIFSRDEKKQDDMRHIYKNEKIKYYLGDVRDYDSVNTAMKGVDYVFSAAALKQVPSCEFYPLEAVKTNVFGMENVLNAAIENGVKKVIGLSTDKAVYPINAMGMSKAIMEKVLVAKSRNFSEDQILMCCTRYGNVMCSRGSVIPLFIDQIKSNSPLTITDPKMTRFMMTLDDAIELVLYAFEAANNGDIFVQKAPATTIGTLAEAIIEVFNAKNEVRIIGTRHGEKLFETLVTREERLRSEDLGKYFCIKSDTRDINYSKYFTEGERGISELEEYTSNNTTRLNKNEMTNMLLKLDIIRDALR